MLEQVKAFTLKDFEVRNGVVWKTINQLSVDDIESLIGYWTDEEIDRSLGEIITEKNSQWVTDWLRGHFNSLSEEDKDKFACALLMDRDTTWHIMREVVSGD